MTISEHLRYGHDYTDEEVELMEEELGPLGMQGLHALLHDQEEANGS